MIPISMVGGGYGISPSKMLKRLATLLAGQEKDAQTLRTLPSKGRKVRSWETKHASYEKPALRSQSSESPLPRLQRPQPFAFRRPEAERQTPVTRLTRSRQRTPRSASTTTRLATAFRRNRGPHIAMALAALIFFFPTASAAPDAAEATFTYSGGEFEGNASFSPAPLHVMAAWPGPGSYSWKLTAGLVVVNITEQTWIEHGSPTNLSKPYGRVAKDPERYTQEYFSNAVANSTSRANSSTIWSVSPRDSPPNLMGIHGSFAVSPHDPKPAPVPASIAYPAPTGATWVLTSDAEMGMTGNFSFHVEDVVVSVSNQTKSASYQSGNRTTGLGPAPPGQPHPAREYHERKIRLDVQNGALVLQTHERPVLMAAGHLQLEGNLIVTLRDVDGKIRYERQEIPLRKTAWEIRGFLQLETDNLGTGDTGLNGRLTAAPSVVGLEPAAVSPETGAANLATSRPEFSWPLLAVATPSMMLFGLLGLAVYRRGRPPTIDDVEAALLLKAPARARTLARRLAKQKPGNAIAVFLLATALGAEEDYGRLLREVEPLAARLSVRRRVGIAYVLAVAGSKEGQAERSLRWAVEAAREPEFRSLLIAEGIPVKSAHTPPETGYV